MEGFPLIHDKQVSSSSSGAQEQRVGRQKESRPWNTKAWLGLRTNTHEHTHRERESNKEKMKQHRMTTKHRKGLTISSKFLKLIVSKMCMLLQKFKEFQLYTKCYCSFICSLFLNLQFFRVFFLFSYRIPVCFSLSKWIAVRFSVWGGNEQGGRRVIITGSVSGFNFIVGYHSSCPEPRRKSQVLDPSLLPFSWRGML